MGLSTVIALLWFARRQDSPLVKALRTRFPQARVRDGSTQISVETTAAAVLIPTPLAQSERQSTERRIIHIFAEVERALQRGPLGDVDRSALVPVTLHPKRTERSDRGARFVIHLHPELDVGFALESPSSGRWLTQDDANDVNPNAILEAAIQRLHHTTDGATVYRDGTPGAELYLIRQDDGLDAARLLLAPLWAKITQATGAPLVIAAPTRDRVYAAPSDQPRSIERLVDRATDDWRARAHPLGTTLWQWSGDRLLPWHLHA